MPESIRRSKKKKSFPFQLFQYMWLLLPLLAIFFFVLWQQQSKSSSLNTVYYLSPSGDDNYAGTKNEPWKTIAKANAMVRPGDTVVFSPGIYEGVINPNRSGTPDAPITYQSAKYRKAILTGKKKHNAVEFKKKSYLSIKDFLINPAKRGGWLTAYDCDHITVQGCYMENASRPLQMKECEQIRLIGNVFSMDQVTGNMCCIVLCSHVVVEGNSFTKVGHSPLQITTCRNLVIRANCFRNNWGRNYEFWASGKILVEGNIITQARDSAHSADSRAKNLYCDGIYRFNRAFLNLHTPLNSLSYFPIGAKPTSYFREPFRLMNSRIYNNTVTNNLGHGWELAGINISANEFMNNVFFDNDKCGGGVQFCVSDTISKDNRFRFNLFGAAHRNQHVILYGGKYWTAKEANKKSRSLNSFWREFESNIDEDPVYVDTVNNDFRLSAESPCIDAGHPLTIAIGNGHGRDLPVSDCRYFYDGYGINGEVGDWIAIGSGNNLAQISKIEFRYGQPSILHLDRDVQWTDGMPVGLPWSGKAPDMGAFEYNGNNPKRLIANASPANPQPGQQVSFRICSLGKIDSITSIEWDFGDSKGGRSKEITPTYSFQNAGTYGVTVRAEYVNGLHGIDVVFIDVAETTKPEAPLVKSDFEDATRDTDWGYLFKLGSSWLTAGENVNRELGGGKCLRIFFDKNKQNRAAAVIAPGAWDIDKYPYICFSYRIPKNVPVALVVEPFPGEKMPTGVILGGTAKYAKDKYIDAKAYKLMDDNQWHEISIDVRQARKTIKDLNFLRRFLFYTNWMKDEKQEFWFDDFQILQSG